MNLTPFEPDPFSTSSGEVGFFNLADISELIKRF